MNKRDAKEMVHRLVCGLIEEYMQSREPDTYGPLFADENVEGRRLSDSDWERFDEALHALQGSLGDVGDRVYKSMKARDGKREWPKPSGKPGSKWKGHAQRLKRWGWP